MRELDEASVDAIVCDPPYELGFMGRAWDSSGVAYRRETWEAALRVLKPGGHLLAFGGTRTYHRLACAIEDAGFEIRDCLVWMYGNGFPKSLNLDGDWQGWGTALKPAYEPIVVARKPLIGTVAENVQRYGTGALNIDGCRIEARGRPARESDPKAEANGVVYAGRQKAGTGFDGGSRAVGTTSEGRWPANVALDPEAAAMLDEQSGDLHPPGSHGPRRPGASEFLNGLVQEQSRPAAYDDRGGASRFFYCAKASKGEREAGLEAFPAVERVNGNKWTDVDYRVKSGERPPSAESGPRRNVHPTVKPINLMRWLVRLVTPPGGLVLDPFAGSGTTGCAAVLEGFDFLGIEREPDYVAIARARIEFWSEYEGQDVEAVLAADARARKQRGAGQETLL